MTEPLVSVSMVTYNHAPYIAQTIEGVLQQKSSFPIELVIGEDCSTDGTREIVFEYQKKYPDIIRVITSDKNVGGKTNIYRTGKACRGKYIACCEGDDYWHHPHKLQIQVDYLETHPECGLVFADCDVYVVGSTKSKKSFNYSNGHQSYAKLDIEQIIWGGIQKWTCTAILRRNLLEQVIENDPYLHQNGEFLMGDTQFWAELSLISEVAYIPESLATYRVLDESASRSKDLIKHLRFWKSVHEMRLYLCNKYNLSESFRKKEESDWCNRSLQLAFHERNFNLASEVKKKKPTFTWKQWLQYFGAKNLVVYYVCRVSVLCRNVFGKEHSQLN